MCMEICAGSLLSEKARSAEAVISVIFIFTGIKSMRVADELNVKILGPDLFRFAVRK